MLKINELFLGIQGESTYAGCLCIILRLTGCHLQCAYCDSQFAFFEGEERTVEQVFDEIQLMGCKLICITGGEPLLQKDLPTLVNLLINNGYTVLLETSGSLSVEKIPREVIKIMDLKTPGSGMEANNLYRNIGYLGEHDEVKFVLSSREDYVWAKRKIHEYDLEKKCKVLLSPVLGRLDPSLLAQWIIEDKVDARLQIQIHKIIWPGRESGI
ncbi:MAG: radical SAM protein [Acidobacteriota bacterium]